MTLTSPARCGAVTAIIAGAVLALGMAVAGCSPAQNAAVDKAITKAASSTEGQLYCTLRTSAGVQILTQVVAAEITGHTGAAAPLVVLAKDATKAMVDDACAKAAIAAGAAAGVPTAPIAGVVPSVTAIVPPAGMPLTTPAP